MADIVLQEKIYHLYTLNLKNFHRNGFSMEDREERG